MNHLLRTARPATTALPVQRYHPEPGKADDIESKTMADAHDGKHGWTRARVLDELLPWAGSMAQFRSVLMGTTYGEWRRIRGHYPRGELLPTKLRQIVPRLPAADRPWPTSLDKRAENDDLPDLDRLASLLLTVLYSTHHVEFHPDTTVTDAEVKTARDAGARGATVQIAAGLRHGKLREQLTAFRRALDQPAPALAGARVAPGANVIPLTDAAVKRQQVSDVGLYCVAVGVYRGVLHVAFNFKVTAYDESTGLRMERRTVVGNVVSARALLNLRDALRTELAHTPYAGMPVAFVRATPRDNVSRDKVHAPAHAEMQLVKLTQEHLRAVGVSKPCCKSCTKTLSATNVQFHRSAEATVTNWLGPSQFDVQPYHEIGATRDVVTLRLPFDALAGPGRRQQRKRLRARLLRDFGAAVLGVEFADGVLTLVVSTTRLRGGQRENLVTFLESLEVAPP